MEPAMKTFFAQTAADAPPASPTGARGKHDFTPARRRPLRGNTMKMFTFGSALAIAAACAATSVYAKPSGNPAGHAAAGHVAGHVHGAVKSVTVTGDNITKTIIETNKINIVDLTITGDNDTVTVEEIGKINSIVSSIVGAQVTVVGIQVGVRNSFSSVAYGNSNTSVAIQFGKESNVSHITQWGDYETAFVVQSGPHNFSSIVQGERSDPPAAADPAAASPTEDRGCRYGRSNLCL
jgi:hypothetical protein